MIGTDYKSVSETLELAGYPEDSEINRAVVALYETLDAQSIDNAETRSTILTLFSGLEDNASAVPDGASTWSDFHIGETVPGDTVRVRRDAYSGSGAKHNGLVGRIVGIRGGRVSVQYLGRSDGVGHSHHPDFIEVLVK